MVAAWMGFGLVVTLLVAGAAALGERMLREAGSGALRWVWASAMVVPGLLAILAHVLPSPGGGELPLSGIGIADPQWIHPGLDFGGEGLLAVHGGAWLQRLDPLLVGLWLLLTLALVLRLASGLFHLRRATRGWREVELPEGRVLVSTDAGPALLGLLRRRVVLPHWCLELDGALRRLILAHEWEHARAGDTLLLTAARGLLVLFPWNLPLWWMHRRLLEAVELDCDRRVTARFPGDRRQYGELLLLVGGRRARHTRLPLTTFAERPSTLARRIDMLSRSPGFPSPSRRLLLAGGALLLVGGACLIPGPDRMDSITGPEADGQEAAQAATPAEDRRTLSREPVFTPFTVAPEVRNRAAVGQALEEEYPALLRDAGVGGTVLVHFFIDEEGALQNVLVAESSGHRALDDAALRVAPVFEFTPAVNRDQPVPVWIQIPITFQTR